MTGDSWNGGTPTPEQARADLVATLNAIEDKLNVPKQLRKAGDRLNARLVATKEEQPLALIAGVAGVAVLVGLAVWGGIRSFTK